MAFRIVDIHTHSLPQVPGTALTCIGCGPVPEQEGHLLSTGLHPWDIAESFEPQLDSVEKLAANPQVIAIGECGFDTLKGPNHEIQEKVFVRHVEISEKYGKPIILHVVKDFDSVTRLRKFLKPSCNWLIHGFRGGVPQMEQLFRAGLLVSFGIRHNEQALRAVPDDRLFLETDGKCGIDEVIQAAAQVRGETPERIESIVIGNNLRLLCK